jgi:hypothetical protein
MAMFRRGPGGSAARRSRPVLALYLVCTLLVFSFILFEVLDVDGSDFPAPPTKATSIKLVEPPHDLKRAAQSGIEGPALLPARAGDSDRPQGPVFLRSPLVSPRARASRVTLPRAALPDASPSA